MKYLVTDPYNLLPAYIWDKQDFDILNNMSYNDVYLFNIGKGKYEIAEEFSKFVSDSGLVCIIELTPAFSPWVKYYVDRGMCAVVETSGVIIAAGELGFSDNYGNSWTITKQ